MKPVAEIIKPPAATLWERLGRLEVFSGFSPDQRDGFLREYENEPGMHVRVFEAGEAVCRKGEYELDLCCILSGALDVLDPLQPGSKFKVAKLLAGEVYGELGAIGGLPRTMDVVAAERSEIFYIPRHALKYVEINPKAREILADRYRERAVSTMIADSELFRSLPVSFIDEVVANSEIVRHELRGVTLVAQGDVADAFFIVRDGFVQVVQERDDGTKRVLGYLRAGEYFGEMSLFDNAQRIASILTAGKCELIKIKREEFVSLCRRFPPIEQELRKLIAARREQAALITPEISELLDKSGQLGVIQADALLVMDLDLCINCDNCVKACEALHGQSRLIRNGIQLGKYLIPSACRHCDDPKCMNSCPTGAIKRRPEGEIYFQYDMCIGCGNCAIACPYDNIAMIDTPTFSKAQAHKAHVTGDRNFFQPYPVTGENVERLSIWKRTFGRERGGQNPQRPISLDQGALPGHTPAAFPIKCDLCDGLPFMGCVHNCPTGAAIRIDPAKLFEETGAVSVGSRVRKAAGGSD
jgi:CRP-like cAMP-binding protein/Fe-S-cluster-containing hydrogenase component 2